MPVRSRVKNLNDNRLKTSFLNEAFYAHQGAATIAYLTDVPLIQVICYRETMDAIRLRFHDPIYPDKTMGKGDFFPVAIQKLHNSFAVLVQKHPEQWECWKYLHAIIKPQEFKQDAVGSLNQACEPCQDLQFNRGLFGLFDINGSYFLFNKRTYSSFPINTTMYDFLLASLRTKANVEQLAPEQLRALYQNNVLTKTSEAYKSKHAAS